MSRADRTAEPTYAVVGTGHWGSNHARVAAELRAEGLVEEAVVCDLDADRARETGERHDLPWYTDAAALADAGVDAATVATPSPTHRAVATELLEAGVDVLVEKPLAPTADEAWALVDAADRAGRTLAVGHIFRHHPAVCALADRVAAGELGTIRHFRTTRFASRVPRAEAGALRSLSVHDVDLFRLLVDDPDGLYCRLDGGVREGVDDTVTLVLDAGDATGVLSASWQVPVYRGKHRDLTLVGTEGAAYLDFLDHTTFELYDQQVTDGPDGPTAAAPEPETVTVDADPAEPLRAEVEDFLAAAARGREPGAPGRVGAAAVELLDAAARSHEAGERLSLDGER
ncbi:Gfo/Idh/MocA family protein [Candidatus Halobonum tyrrellensis]|uniref:Oxidoreductase-like protein n=1 Tax=Candidatus Halobonum tyrrellensis G22 TaxID=1324957 RepID=V4H8B5_9EURY|nr:Gfo/Idh/MocA family oxidoreductase [Candidatus Halobonum tyrrellensis]ESP86925.1 oxidoreductase-like protein [Candidatus Halobonum tyrrellensis G22]